MSNDYKDAKSVPTEKICERLSELASSVVEGKLSVMREFVMHVPAECDRDADIVLSEAVNRIKDSQKKLDKANQYLNVLSEALCDKPDAYLNEMLIAICGSVSKERVSAFIDNQKDAQARVEKSEASKSIVEAAGFKHTIRVLEELLRKGV